MIVEDHCAGREPLLQRAGRLLETLCRAINQWINPCLISPCASRELRSQLARARGDARNDWVSIWPQLPAQRGPKFRVVDSFLRQVPGRVLSNTRHALRRPVRGSHGEGVARSAQIG